MGMAYSLAPSALLPLCGVGCMPVIAVVPLSTMTRMYCLPFLAES